MNKKHLLLCLTIISSMSFGQHGYNDTNFNNNTFISPIDLGFTGLLNYSISIQSDDKILVGGNFTSYDNDSILGLIRLLPNGEKDTTFNYVSGNNVKDMYVLSNNSILVCTEMFVFRILPSGAFDSSFNFATFSNGEVYSIDVQQDGKIIVGGSFQYVNGVLNHYIVRLNTDGTLDNSFSSPLFDNATFGMSANKVKVLNNGKIMAGGKFSCCSSLVRIDSTGVIDNTFFANSLSGITVYDFIELDNSDIIFGGTWSSFGGHLTYTVNKLKQDGSVDLSFVSHDGGVSGYTSHRVTSVNYLHGNRVLIGGYFPLVNGLNRSCFLIDENGNRDASFDVNEECFGTGGLTEVYDSGVQSTGGVIIGGRFGSIGNQIRNNVARINVDSSFVGLLGHDKINYSLFPNPTSEKLNISFGKIEGAKVIRIIDLSGKMILSKQTNNLSISLDLNIAAGYYQIIVSTEDDQVLVNEKLVIQK